MMNDFSVIVNNVAIYNSIDSIIWQLIKYINISHTSENDIIQYIYEIYQSTYASHASHASNIECELNTQQLLDIISKRYKIIDTSRKTLYNLLAQPQVAQRSPEWYELRKNRLTASAVAQAIGKGKFASKDDLLKDKAFPELAKPFDSHTCKPLRHGIILEDMTARCYSQRLNNIKIHNFGMIPHYSMTCFGASPDGINELGIMVEIKTPYRRRVDGNIPYEYMVQMQGQMAVCNLTECDFVDAEIYFDYRCIEDYTNDIELVNSNSDHGIILEYIDTEKNRQYVYSPEYLYPAECLQWAHQKKLEICANYPQNNCLILPWKLVKILIKRVYFNEEVWNELIPQIKNFWDEVIALRNAGVDTLPVKKLKCVKSKVFKNKAAYASQFIDSDED